MRLSELLRGLRGKREQSDPPVPTAVPTKARSLVVDDVHVRKGRRNVELDVRVRNPGDSVANITRAQLNVISREPAIGVPQTSAHYDLLLGQGDNSIPVTHALGPDEVDRFTIRVGFTKSNLSCWFRVTLSLVYNQEETTTSKPFSIDSFFK